MKKLSIIILSLFAFSKAFALNVSDKEVEETLSRLDSEIEKKETYLNQKQKNQIYEEYFQLRFCQSFYPDMRKVHYTTE